MESIEADAYGEPDMDFFGYEIIDTGANPSPRRLGIIENTIRSQKKETMGLTTHCVGTEESNRLLDDGLQRSVSRISGYYRRY